MNSDRTLEASSGVNQARVTAHKPDILEVPNTALRFRPPGAADSPAGTVWILGPDGPRFRL
jgi:hypothetical protein